MAGRWFYANDGNKQGPFTAQQLVDLAGAGDLLPTDTVWKDGVDAGVVASRVKNLFPNGIPSSAAPEPAPVELAPLVDAPSAEMPALVAEAPPPAETEKYRPNPQPQVAKKGLATALKGADIVGQDGQYARYRMKCTKCGHKDASTRSIQITSKQTKSGFFCPKCKKRCEVVIQCRSG